MPYGIKQFPTALHAVMMGYDRPNDVFFLKSEGVIRYIGYIEKCFAEANQYYTEWTIENLSDHLRLVVAEITNALNDPWPLTNLLHNLVESSPHQ